MGGFKRMAKKAVASAACALAAFPAGPGAALAAQVVTLDGIEVHEDQVRVHLSGDAEHTAFTTANPPRIILQVQGAEYRAGARSYPGKGALIKGVRSGQFQREPSMVSRVVLDLAKMAAYQVMKGDGVITVALEGAEASAAGPAPAEEPEEEAEPAASAAPAAPAALARVPVGETEGMTTETTAGLAAMAKARDVTKAAPPRDAMAAAPRAPAPRLRMPRGDIMSRLPRDLVSLDFDNTDIRDVLKLLASKAKINLIYGSDVGGTLTLHLVDVPFNEAFRTSLSMMGLQTMQVGDNILRVLTPAALQRTQSAAATATKVIPLNYSKATEIIGIVNAARQAEGRTGTTIADDKTNSLIVTESLEGLAATERLVSQLDVRPKQVLIEVKLIEVGLNNSLHYGIQWDYLGVDGAKIGGQQGTNTIGTVDNPNSSTLTKPLDQNAAAVVGVGAGGRGTGVALPATSVFGALTFGRITNNYFLSATLTAAAQQGKIKVLSDPKVATLNNKPANINVTTQIPYTTSNVTSTGVATQAVAYVTTGIQLTVTPTINADGRITLQIQPSVSQPSATVAASATGAPGIDSRNANTTVLVKDGETIVLGGLISDSVSNTIAKIPILGDIPILGWLFKKKSVTRQRSELLIFVTPKILED